jgi:hypothetical protein
MDGEDMGTISGKDLETLFDIDELVASQQTLAKQRPCAMHRSVINRCCI